MEWAYDRPREEKKRSMEPAHLTGYVPNKVHMDAIFDLKSGVFFFLSFCGDKGFSGFSYFNFFFLRCFTIVYKPSVLGPGTCLQRLALYRRDRKSVV